MCVCVYDTKASVHLYCKASMRVCVKYARQTISIEYSSTYT